MILDTTYLLPLAKIDVDTDLLKAIAESKVNLKFNEITINSISIFELQAKTASLSLPPRQVCKSIDAILSAFKVEPFYKPKILEVSFEAKELIQDYIDCVIVATAASLRESLVTEDSRILNQRKAIEARYDIEIVNYAELLQAP